ncbi:MAG: hypothetical protein J5770_04020 [Bacteroidaceae bacterium]|nr:hypothetical protein [Bacteroidaceae bacterium]
MEIDIASLQQHFPPRKSTLYPYSSIFHCGNRHCIPTAVFSAEEIGIASLQQRFPLRKPALYGYIAILRAEGAHRFYWFLFSWP